MRIFWRNAGLVLEPESDQEVKALEHILFFLKSVKFSRKSYTDTISGGCDEQGIVTVD